VRFEFGDFAESERLRREAWSGAERALGRDHPDAILLQARAAGAMLRGDREQAEQLEQLARDALERLRALRPAEPVDVAQAQLNLAWMLFARGELEEPERLVREAIAALHKSLGRARRAHRSAADHLRSDRPDEHCGRGRRAAAGAV
jgi:tetratricopeptide (TPR) repeat protein